MSQVFKKYLDSKEIQHSFSRKGNSYDNACIESFHSMLKKEEFQQVSTDMEYNEAAYSIKLLSEYLFHYYKKGDCSVG